ANQSNNAENNASSANHNGTEQGNWQNQGGAATGVSVSGGGDGPGCGYKGKDGKDGNGGQQVDQSQSASNSNSTSQSAESEAESEQENVNVPIAVNSPCSNNGDVEQSNGAENNAYSANHNDTDQDNWQNQGGAATARTS